MESAPSLVVYCRFVPLDLWFTCRVSIGWKIEDVKVCLLSKCLDGNTPRELGRAPSPITFAPDPRRRPISPITFAASKRPNTNGNGSAYTSADESLGYEEDDEFDEAFDSDDPFPETAKLRSISHQYNQPKQHRHVNSLVSSAALSKLTFHNASTLSQPIMDPHVPARNYNIVRYSTGQVLEDHFTLSMYQLNAHELLEVHRSGVVLRLSRRSVTEYIEPYFESPVHALRVLQTRDPQSKDSKRGNSSDCKIPDANSKQRFKFEWKQRWVVIQHGILSLCTSSDDKIPVQRLSLANLLALRGAEHLKHTNSVKPGQRIVCAQFRRVDPNDAFGADKPKLKAKPEFTTSFEKPKLKIQPKIMNQNMGPYLKSLPTPMLSPSSPMAIPKNEPLEPDNLALSCSPVFAPIGDFTEASGKYEPGTRHSHDSDGAPTMRATPTRSTLRKKRSDVHLSNGDMSTDEKKKQRTVSRKSKGKQKAVETDDDEAEWIVLCFGDSGTKGYLDNAFASMLRILHRQAALLECEVSSTFMPELLKNAAPSTPFPSPTSLWHAESGNRPSMASSRSSSMDSDSRRPRHPHSLASLAQPINSQTQGRELLETYGALPYPEWRKEIVQKAKTAGIGDVGPALAYLLCGASARVFQMSRPRRQQSSSGTVNSDGSSDLGAYDSDGENSEVEWTAWMGDLHRQKKKREEESATTDNELESAITEDSHVGYVQDKPLSTNLSSPSSTESMYRRANTVTFTGKFEEDNDASTILGPDDVITPTGRRPSMPSLLPAPSPEGHQNVITSTVSVGRAHLPRRSSSASVGISRSGSVLAKAFARKRDEEKEKEKQDKDEAKRAAKEAEKIRQRAVKGKAAAGKTTPDHLSDEQRQQRRKSITNEPELSSRLRHARSKSSLQTSEFTTVPEIPTPMPLKKWTINKEKILNKFESSMDFVNSKSAYT